MNLVMYSKYILIVAVLIVSAFFVGLSSTTADDTMQQVEREMPVLRGDLWIKMSEDEKIFKVIEASVNSPMKMHEVSEKIDAYYEKNPDKLSTSVVEVMWYETIEPRLGKKGN